MVQYLQKIPLPVRQLVDGFHAAGFEAYIVGGCVRDLLCGTPPSDWDVATNARPEQTMAMFPDSYCDNKFGTVVVRMGQPQTPDYLEIEVTPYRIESKYTDKRHPDKVEWADNIDEDLSRRDFTVNAIALRYIKEGAGDKVEVIDLFGGQADLKAKLIRAVRDPNERFLEDALRLMRAVRFAVTLGEDWHIEPATETAIKNNAKWLKEVSQERVRDEFIKMIMSPRAAEGVELLRSLGLLPYVIPELLEGYEVSQNKHHIFDCYQHSIKALDFAARKGFGMQVRMASLLHDIGKPRA
jgi:tRNA nucleotidyltransferase (CCA-adding enzyme)